MLQLSPLVCLCMLVLLLPHCWEFSFSFSFCQPFSQSSPLCDSWNKLRLVSNFLEPDRGRCVPSGISPYSGARITECSGENMFSRTCWLQWWELMTSSRAIKKKKNAEKLSTIQLPNQKLLFDFGENILFVQCKRLPGWKWIFFSLRNLSIKEDERLRPQLNWQRTGRLKLTLPINILTPVNCWFDDQALPCPLQICFLSLTLSQSFTSFLNKECNFYRKKKKKVGEALREKERERVRKRLQAVVVWEGAYGTHYLVY